MQIHTAELSDSDLVQEEFQKNGYGSAFVTREDELVILVVRASGVSQLPDKVHQLVDKGFHAIVVDLSELDEVDNDGLRLFIKSKQVLENWGGRLSLCSLSKPVHEAFEGLGVVEEFHVFDDKDGAVEGCRVFIAEKKAKEAAEAEAEESGDDLESSAETLTSSDMLESGDDLSDDEDEDSAGDVSGEPGDSIDQAASALDSADRIALDSAEFAAADLTASEDFLESDEDLSLEDSDAGEDSDGSSEGEPVELVELGGESVDGLGARVDGLLEAGAPRAMVKLKLDRRLNTDDVEVLRMARDRLSAAGGGLALVELPRDMALWLRLQGFDKEFSIFAETAEATSALRNGLSAGASGDSGEAGASEASEESGAEGGAEGKGDASSTDAEPEPSAKVEVIPMPSTVVNREDLGVAEAVEDGELEELLAQRDVEIAKLRAELANLKESVAEGQKASASAAADEVEELKSKLESERSKKSTAVFERARLEGQVQELQDRLSSAERDGVKVAELEKALEDQKASVKSLEERLASKDDELEAAGARASKAEGRIEVLQEELGRSSRRVSELEMLVQTMEREMAEKGLDGFDPDELPEDADELKELLAKSEQEKMRILADAEVEIERLNREQDLLREELESAGEMIERLGKELELS